MQNTNETRISERVITALAHLSVGCLTFNMFAIAVFADDLLVRRDTITGVGPAVMAGFTLVLFFNLLCVAWSAYQLSTSKSESTQNESTPFAERIAPEYLGFGIVCLILMAGEKVMVDEIGRETVLGWETTGEWLVLYTLLSVQLVYTLFLLPRFRELRNSGLARSQSLES